MKPSNSFNAQSAKQRSPSLKPSSPVTPKLTIVNGQPISHDKDPNAFRWPKRYLYPSTSVQALLGWKQFQKIGSGLYNMGNTCFANSVLQALAYTPPLANYLRRGEHSKQCRIRNAGDQFCLFCALEVTYKHMSSGSGPAIQPREIIRHLRAISRSFRLGRQEDSHEFLRFVIEMLQANDLACYGGAKRITDLRMQETTALFGMFGGYLRSQVRCLKCGYNSNTYDAFLDLSLEVSDVSSVQKALQSFTRPERLDGENMYRCSRCSKKVPALKQLTIFKPPTVLCVQLKRFQFANSFGGYGGFGGGGGKINKPILYTDRLDLSPFISDHSTRPGYSLYAVLVHSGSSVHSGHYYCYVKSQAGQWHCMDDSSVRQVGLQHVLEQRAYILFYVRDKIETLPIAAPSPAGPTPVANLAQAAAMKKVDALNLDGKKLPTVPETKPATANTIASTNAAAAVKPIAKPAHHSDGDSDEGEEEEEDEDEEDDESYNEGDSDESMNDSQDEDDDEDEEEDASEDGSDDSLNSSLASDSSIFDPPRVGPSSFELALQRRRRRVVRTASLRSLGLLPSIGGMPRLFKPFVRATSFEEERDAPFEADDDDEMETAGTDAKSDDHSSTASRKRKRLIEEMTAEVADLSDDDDVRDGAEEDEEIDSDMVEDESSSSEEDDSPPPPKSKPSAPSERPSANSQPKRQKLDEHESTSTKANPSAAPTPASAEKAKPKPQPFYFSEESERAAKEGKKNVTAVPVANGIPSSSAPTPSKSSSSPGVPTSNGPTPTSNGVPSVPPPPRSAVSSSGPIIVSREAFDPRAWNREFKASQFGAAVGDWESTVTSVEATRHKYAMKRHQDLANAKLTPQVKPKDAWDAELDKGHVRKVRTRDAIATTGTAGPDGKNLFQATQNARNHKKELERTGQVDESTHQDSRPKKRGPSRGLAAKGYTTHRERKLKAKQGKVKGLRDF